MIPMEKQHIDEIRALRTKTAIRPRGMPPSEIALWLYIGALFALLAIGTGLSGI